MTYQNPIIPGFHPDPSLCRVGEDYYLVTSSFEYFPGLPLFHSRDLVNWQQIGHCLDRPEQIVLSGEHPNGLGLFAPTLRYHEGRFYVVCTNVGGPEGAGGNFVIWTDDIRGPWSDPVWIDLPGIDPSLYFEDGRVYYTGTADTIYLAEIDLATGRVLGDRHPLWEGSGGADREAPHLFRIGEFYYLFISEGGTAQCHMLTVARSRNLRGPYESCPRNPVLTNRSLAQPLRAVGHADLVQAHDGSWWAVCLGIRVVGYPDYHLLGRETLLVPLTWGSDGWPLLGHNGAALVEMEGPAWPRSPVPSPAPRDEFRSARLSPVWNFIGTPAPGLWSTAPAGGLSLFGTSHTISSEQPVAWVGRRQQHLSFTARTSLEFDPRRDGEAAGLSIYLNNTHHYDVQLALEQGRRVLQFRRQIGTLWKLEASVVPPPGAVELVLEGRWDRYRLGWAATGSVEWLGEGEARPLSTEAGGRFTGAYIGLFATGGGAPATAVARFNWFEYAPD